MNTLELMIMICYLSLTLISYIYILQTSTSYMTSSLAYVVRNNIPICTYGTAGGGCSYSYTTINGTSTDSSNLLL